MDFFDLIKKRRACHNFQAGKTIPKEDIIKMVDAARYAPSGYNAQPWEFIIIEDPEQIKKIHGFSFKQDHILNASALVVVLGDLNIGRNVDQLLDDWIEYGYLKEEERHIYHNSIAKNRSEDKLKGMAMRNSMLAAMTLIYAAEELGYATCPMMAFSQYEVEEHLNIPKDRMISLFIALGHEKKDDALKRLPRKSVDSLIHWEKFGS